MKHTHTTWAEIDMIGKLADLKQDHYRLTLAVSTLMELLVEKGLLQQEDISRKAAELDPYVACSEYGDHLTNHNSPPDLNDGQHYSRSPYPKR